MSPLWVLPLVVLAAGAVAVVVATRRVVAEVADARPELAALRRLADDARTVRADVETAVERGAALRDVPTRFRTARRAAREARLDQGDR